MAKGILKYSFFFYASVPFFVRHGKTSLASMVESVFEIHCSTEGPYIYLYGWNTEIRSFGLNKKTYYAFLRLSPDPFIPSGHCLPFCTFRTLLWITDLCLTCRLPAPFFCNKPLLLRTVYIWIFS